MRQCYIKVQLSLHAYLETQCRGGGWIAVTLQQTPETRLLPDVVGAGLVFSATSVLSLGTFYLLNSLFANTSHEIEDTNLCPSVDEQIAHYTKCVQLTSDFTNCVIKPL